MTGSFGMVALRCPGVVQMILDGGDPKILIISKTKPTAGILHITSSALDKGSSSINGFELINLSEIEVERELATSVADKNAKCHVGI